MLGLKDGNEPETNGSLVYARDGKGVYIYTGLSFFRELPAGVPGAFRLFVNLDQPDSPHAAGMNDVVSPEGAGPCGLTQPRMARIPGGFFLMGSETGQDNERPVHRVWLDEFLVGRMPSDARGIRAIPLGDRPRATSTLERCEFFESRTAGGRGVVV